MEYKGLALEVYYNAAPCANACSERIEMINEMADIKNTSAECSNETEQICPVGAIK